MAAGRGAGTEVGTVIAVAGTGAGGRAGGAPNSRLTKPGSSGVAEAACGTLADNSSSHDSDNGSWEFSMLNGTLRMGSGGAALKTDSNSLSGEFAGMLMSRTRSTGSGSGAHRHRSSGSQRHAGGSAMPVIGGDGAPAGGPSRIDPAGLDEGCDDEGFGGGKEEEEEEAVAWHSLEATPLIDAVSGKKVGDPGIDMGDGFESKQGYKNDMST